MESGGGKFSWLAKGFMGEIMQEFLLLAQLLTWSDFDFQDWVDSRPPAELCKGFKDGLIPETMLPGGRAQTPCSSFNGDDPMNYVIE